MRHHVRDDLTPVAGGSTDQHVTGHEETGTFQTDEPPTFTPADGSSNSGINTRHANRQPGEGRGEDLSEDDEAGDDA